jgi:cell wall-associated NlpC family hydrolase
MRGIYTIVIYLSLFVGIVEGAREHIILEEGARSYHSNAPLRVHIIQKGDTLFSIARKYRTTLQEIQQENPSKRFETLSIDSVMIVPIDTYDHLKKIPISHYTSHKVKQGETLYAIAKRYDTSVEAILRKNLLEKGSVLSLGQSLEVPNNRTLSFLKSTPKKRLAKTKEPTKSTPKIAKSALKKPSQKITAKSSPTKSISSIEKSIDVDEDALIALAKSKLGRRYVFGASGKRNTYDCSSFTKYVYKKQGVKLPRTSLKQSKVGKYVSKEKLKKGDLLFFDTSRRKKGYVNHVGIYMGDGKFIHASSAKKKVVISKLEDFYLKRYRGARRPS